MNESEVVLIRSRTEVLAQMSDAHKAMVKCEAKDLEDFYKKDPKNFSLLIEAFDQLGGKVSEDLKRKANLRPVKEVLGVP